MNTRHGSEFAASCLLPYAFSLLPATHGFADATFKETFEHGSNEGGWSYGTGQGFIEGSGGNPGAYFHDPMVDTFAPQPSTVFGVNSLFTGNYRSRKVFSIGINLITHAVDFSADERPLTIMLVSDNGTPGNFNDDWAAYYMGAANIPLPGQGWISYEFDIPSQETMLPAGWNTLAFGPNSPPNPDWKDVITDVTQLRFFYGDPTLFFIFQVWNVGLDNPSISLETPPVPALAERALRATALLLILAGVAVFSGPAALDSFDPIGHIARLRK